MVVCGLHTGMFTGSGSPRTPYEKGLRIYRDEVRLSEPGLVLHEIEFLARENWLIEREDIEASWEPLLGSDTAQD
jgi:hypothetical protein